MPFVPDQQINTGSYVQQTPIFDVSKLYEVEVNSPEFKELLVILAQQTNNISLVLNNKISGYYLLEEFVTGANYFNPNSTDPLQLKPEFGKTFNIGALPAGVTNVAHNLTITNTWQFTNIYGTANDNVGSNYYPLPFASAGGATNIELRVNATNIVITNNSGINFTSCLVTLKYLK